MRDQDINLTTDTDAASLLDVDAVTLTLDPSTYAVLLTAVRDGAVEADRKARGARDGSHGRTLFADHADRLRAVLAADADRFPSVPCPVFD